MIGAENNEGAVLRTSGRSGKSKKRAKVDFEEARSSLGTSDFDESATRPHPSTSLPVQQMFLLGLVSAWDG